jgi:hypothetical protein
MTIDITTMPHAVSNSNPSGNWTYAFYEAQLQILANGGGTIYFPAGNYVFHETLQVFMVGGIIRGEHAQTTTITIQPLSTDSLDGRYRDGMIVHNAATAQLQAAGFNYSYPIPAIIPSISPGGAGTPTQPLINATTGDGIVIENITLQYNAPPSADDFIAGFGHGIVLHRGTCCIRDCVVSGFNADGIHINAIVYGSNVIQNWFQDPNIPSPGDPNLGLNYAYSNTTNHFGVYANIPTGSNVPQFNHFDINPITLNIVQAATGDYVPTGSALSVQFGNYVNIGNVPTFIEESQMTSLMAAGLITVTVTPDIIGSNISTVTVSIDINYSSLASFDGLIGQQYVMQIFATINGQLVPLTIIHPTQGYAITPRIVVLNYASNYPSVYTNANLTQVYNTTVQNCGRHGIFTWDNDANACTFVNVLAINNQGWGIFETSWLGNTYTACRAYNNAIGDYFALAMDGGVNTSVFVDCQTADTPQPTILVCLRAQNWMGGSSNHYTPLDTIPNIAPLAPQSSLPLQSSKIQRNGTLTPFTFLNNIPPLKTNQTDYDTKARVRFTPGGSNDLSLMSFAAYYLDNSPPLEYTDRANWDLRFRLGNNRMKSFSFVGNGLDNRHPLQLSSILTHINAHNMGVDAIPRPIPLSNIFLNKPFIVGNIQADDLLKNQVWVHDTGDLDKKPDIDTYQTQYHVVVGDILLNINPNMEIPELRFASWICVEQADGNLAFKGMEAIF